MKLIEELFGGVKLYQSIHSKDDRGEFLKVFRAKNEPEFHYEVQQINYVNTAQKNTLRGLHIQKGDCAESKIFKCMKGSIQLVFIDLRPDSTTFKLAGSFILNQIMHSILIPRGFATGYLTLESDSTILYTADNHYFPESETGLRWNDPLMKIQWASNEPFIVSDKDLNWPDL